MEEAWAEEWVCGVKGVVDQINGREDFASETLSDLPAEPLTLGEVQQAEDAHRDRKQVNAEESPDCA